MMCACMYICLGALVELWSRRAPVRAADDDEIDAREPRVIGQCARALNVVRSRCL
jgi:hypothetical protein